MYRAVEKRSSLLCLDISDEGKKFLNIGIIEGLMLKNFPLQNYEISFPERSTFQELHSWVGF